MELRLYYSARHEFSRAQYITHKKPTRKPSRKLFEYTEGTYASSKMIDRACTREPLFRYILV